MRGSRQGCKLFAMRLPSDNGSHVGMPWRLPVPHHEPFGELRVNYASRTLVFQRERAGCPGGPAR